MIPTILRRCSLVVLCAIVSITQVNGQSMGAWTNTGPMNFPVNQSGQVNGLGRVSQIKFHPTNSQKIYAVSASGGVYLSSNNGVNWTPLAGTEVLPQTSCSAICVNDSNDKTLYLSLGDADYYSNNYGIYKSYNGGLTWAAANTTVGNKMAVEILMDPTDTNTVVAATSGGVYRTTNGGNAWTLTQSGVFRDMKAKAAPRSRTLFAATASAFYVSTDFGLTWTSITSGLSAIPTSNGGMRIAVSRADSNRVYLATTGGNGVIFSSVNGGTSFTPVFNSSAKCLVCYDSTVSSGSQGNYNIDINANPQNANELLLIAHNVWRSTDGGVTWKQRTIWWNQVHTDMHHIEWNPYNNAQIWNANDGGVWMSTDTTAQVWVPRCDGLAAHEVYHAAQSPVVRELISVGAQDNGELYYNSTGWKTNRGGDWTTPCAIDYRGSGTVWYTARGTRRNLAPLGGDQTFNAPYTTSTGTFVQNDQAKIEFIKGLPAYAFVGRDSVYRCTNVNATTPSWQLIRPSTGILRAMASSRADSNILYVAASPNVLYRSDNALATTPTWTTLTTPASISVVASIATSSVNPNVVFMSCGNTVYRSVDKGVTWTNITGTGLSGLNIRKIYHDDYSTKQRLFVNAGAYVHYKDSTATAWTNHSANMGLPTVANGTDFMIYNDGSVQSILRFSTYGRGVWQCNIADNSKPMAGFIADRTMVCVGDSVHFSATVNGTYTSLLWSFPGGTPSTSTVANPVVRYSTAGIYAVTLIATNSYGSDTLTKLAFIDASAGGVTQLTEGFEGTTFPPAGWSTDPVSQWQQNSGVGGYGTSSKCLFWDNYNNDDDGNHDRFITRKVDLTAVSAARLKFDLAYANYPGYPDSLQVRISTDCGNTWTTVYTKTGSALATAGSYTAAIFVPTAAQWRTDSVSLTPFAGSSVLVSFENIGHYGQALYLDNINLLTPPRARFGVSDTNICAGGQLTFSDSSINGNSRTWVFTGGTPATSTAANPTVSYSTAGNYAVKLIVSNTVGSDSVVKTSYIHVLPKPGVSAGNDTSICVGKSVTITATGAVSYSWSPTTNLSAATGATVVSTPTGNITYTVTGVDANGCQATAQKTIYVNPLPVLSVSPANASMCGGTSITLTANGATTYFWTPAAGLNTTIGASVVASPAANTTYTVVGTDINGCQSSATKQVIVSAAPTISITPTAAITICNGNTASLTASGGITYTWTPSGSLSAGTGASVTASPASTTTYSVTATDANGCQGTANKTVTVNPKPNVVISPATAVSICSGTSATLSASGATSYSWTPATGLSATNTATVTASPVANTVYTVTGTDGNGCTNTATKAVAVLARPNVSVNASTTSIICQGASVTLTANGASTYSWSPSATLSSGTGNVVTATPTVTTRYVATGTALNGCTDTAGVTVNVRAAPSSAISPAGRVDVCQDDSVTLTATPGYSSYTWMIYGTPIVPASGNKLTTGTGGYYTLTVVDANNCTSTSANPTIVTIVQRPTPVITRSGAALDAGPGFFTYQWYRNGVAVPGATGRTYTPGPGGMYTVEVIADTVTKCLGVSQGYQYTAAAVGSISKTDQVRIYPNPALNVVHISAIVPVDVTVKSADGKTVFSGSNVREIPVSAWADGAYLFTVSDKDGQILLTDRVTKISAR